MEILIVHHDAELGEQLVRMVKDYTAHECDYVGSGKEALGWAQRHARCALLITQLDGEGVDGLNLGASMSEIFSGLQTIFLPAYRTSEQWINVTKTKIFPEPIDGEGVLAAVERAQTAKTSSADFFDVVDILQMCCLSGRSGALQMVKGRNSGIVYLRHGRVVHAETISSRGHNALEEIVSWELVEFAYDGTVRPPLETISRPWYEILIDSVVPERPQSAA